MANREVNLTKRVETPKGWRYCGVVFSANGRVKPDVVIIDGREEHHPGGAYYLSWREGSKQRRLSVGKSASDANARLLAKTAELNARVHGVPIAAAKTSTPTIAAAIASYLAEIKVTQSPATLAAYTLALQNFTASCTKQHMGDITRTDLIEYTRYLRQDLGLSDRTAHNRRTSVLTFLRAYGVEKLLLKKDKVRFVAQMPETYEEAELGKFFAACDAEERVFFEFLLMTGFRKKEAAFVTWRDVDLSAGLARVTAKPEYDFRPKDFEEREVPIPDRLIKLLKSWAKQRNGSELVFPTRNGTPRKHRTQLLDLCKTIAKRAKLDPNDFWLHKFRATFATRHLQGGVDLRTVQQWLGHSDLESTMRYLKPSRSQKTRDKVNEVFA